MLFSTWEYEGEINLEEQTTDVELDLTEEGGIERFYSILEATTLPNNKPKWHYYFITDPNRDDVSYIINRQVSRSVHNNVLMFCCCKPIGLDL